MAAPFVPVPFPVDWTGACRSLTKYGSLTHATLSINGEPSTTLGSVSLVKGVGPWGAAAVRAPTLEDSWSKPRGGMLDGSSTQLEGERNLGEGWVERPNTPTLLGYEILEERAKFTVYRILVTGGQGDSWVIFRRYSDFCRLSDKLKELFPSVGLSLPPKRWLKDNYEEEFLKERLIGLQTFLQNLTSHKHIFWSEAVRHFLCLVYPPGPFDSPEESRAQAFCETLEETNHRLLRDLLENQREVDSLKELLEEKENQINLLVKKVNESLEGPCQLTAQQTDPNACRGKETQMGINHHKRKSFII